MADYHNPSDQVNGSDADSDSGFESLHRQLDAFLEQQKNAVIDGAGHGSNELQHRLDHFINNLQQKLDTFVKESPTRSSHVRRAGDNHVKQQAQSGAPEPITARPAKKQPAPEFPVIAGSTNATSYSQLIASVLIAASGAVAVMLWLGWPVEQAGLPQQQGVDEHALAPELSETMASSTVAVHQSGAAVVKKPASSPAIVKQHGFKKTEPSQLTGPVLAVQSNPARQHNIPTVETAVQSGVATTVRLTVTAWIGNIRDKPDKSGEVLFRLARGAVVTRLGERQGWFKVRLRNGNVAWAHRSIF